MTQTYPPESLDAELFKKSEAAFFSLVSRLRSSEVLQLPHAEVEAVLQSEGMEVLRQLFEDHVELRSLRESEAERVMPEASDGVPRERARRSQRTLRSVFGDVVVKRLSWTAPGVPGLRPLDATLNLTGDLYSFGVRRKVVERATHSSYDVVVDQLGRDLGAGVPKRQAEQLVERAAQDFDAFYARREGVPVAEGDDLGMMSFDGKGVVMRHGSLRPKTQAAASSSKHKLKHRLCRGEKANRKRMAAVAAVWTAASVSRGVDDIVREPGAEPSGRPRRLRAHDKRVWAHLDRSMPEVIDAAFVEAKRRDPDQKLTWVVLIDGDRNLRRYVETAARKHDMTVHIVLDVVHVVEYLWKAGWALFGKESPDAEAWVTVRLRRLLQGQVSGVASGMRRSATMRGLTGSKRKAIDRCANYLLERRNLAQYDRFLQHGFPIATGVIEGACRHLLKDRLDITGARWGLDGAESVLRLRAISSSGDSDDYWLFHQKQELHRNHRCLYANDPTGVAA